MSRAFPTFRVYFIEEDMPEWNRLDDKYAYQAIASIDITKSRYEAADVAVIKFFNTSGKLDNAKFESLDAHGNIKNRRGEESFKTKDQETVNEQTLDAFVLKAGTMIKIKMGYYADPELLDTVFTGMVAEIGGGDIIEVVAQGYGVELLNPVPKPSYQVYRASAFKLLDKLITSPLIKHFGKVQWFVDSPSVSKKLFRRQIPDPGRPGKFKGASWWRNIAGVRYVLGIREDTRDNNIWVPENSWVYNMIHGGHQTFITKDKSIWDVFREMSRRMPGYIATVLPFDNRATIYFGPADFMYWATAEKKDEMNEWEIQYRNAVEQSDLQKIAEMMSSGVITRQTPEQLNERFKKLSKYFSDLSFYLSDNLESKDKLNAFAASLDGRIKNSSTSLLNSKTLLSIGGIGTSAGELASIMSTKGYNAFMDHMRENALSFAKTTMKTTIEGVEKDEDIDNLLDFCSNIIESQYDTNIRVEVGCNGRMSIEYVGKDAVYVDKDGKTYTESGIVDWYDKKRLFDWAIDNPSRKLVRNYHYKDSFHHIIANNIVATAQYLCNRVTVEYGSEAEWKKQELSNSPPNFKRMSVQADDDIWPEMVREVIIQEKNAISPILAWQYGLGNLWEEMRKMYSGSLVMLGDASIKPYDIIMMSDYFTDMYGPVEVEQVTHHFSPDTGFVTTIIPNLVCHVNNMLQEGSLTIAGAYMDNVTKFVESAQSGLGLYGVLGGPGDAIGNTVANVCFWLASFGDSFREPISLTPLIYAGRPYVAGVEGMRKTSFFEAKLGKITRFIKQRNRIEDAIGSYWNTAMKFFGASLQS